MANVDHIETDEPNCKAMNVALSIEDAKIAKIAIRAALASVVVAAGFLAGCPYYNVYQQHMDGMATLAKAQYSKQVLVEDAKAREESAKSLAQAEITRAKGVAEANKIIGDSLEGNESYLRYLWIHNLEAGAHDTIYIATEAGMPILESGRFQRSKDLRAADAELQANRQAGLAAGRSLDDIKDEEHEVAQTQRAERNSAERP